MVNRIRVSDPRELYKGHGLKFRVNSRIQVTPEEGRKIDRLKRYEYNNKDEEIIRKYWMIKIIRELCTLNKYLYICCVFFNSFLHTDIRYKLFQTQLNYTQLFVFKYYHQRINDNPLL